MTNLPPSRMDFLTALAWCDVGWSIRRAHWRLTEAIPGQTSGTGDVALIWIRAEPAPNPGLYLYHDDSGEGIMTNTRLTHTDMQAEDWTADPVDGNAGNLNPDLVNPNAGVSAIPAGPIATDPATGSSAGGPGGLSGGDEGGAGGGGSGGGAGGGSGDGSGSFGSGGSGAGGGGGVSKKGPVYRSPATLTMSPINRESSGCVSNLFSGSPPLAVPDTAPRPDRFSGSVTLNDPSARAGEIWFLTITHNTPAGPVTDFHGTIVNAQTVGFAFNITAPPGATFAIHASAWLPFNNLTATASPGTAQILRGCNVCPAGTYARNGDLGIGCYTTPESGGYDNLEYVGPQGNY